MVTRMWGSHSLVNKELELLHILSLIKLLEAQGTNSCMGGVPRPSQQSWPIEAVLPNPNQVWANWGLLAGGRDRGREYGRLASHREGPWEVDWPWEVGCGSTMTIRGQLLR